MWQTSAVPSHYSVVTASLSGRTFTTPSGAQRLSDLQEAKAAVTCQPPSRFYRPTGVARSAIPLYLLPYYRAGLNLLATWDENAVAGGWDPQKRVIPSTSSPATLRAFPGRPDRTNRLSQDRAPRSAEHKATTLWSLLGNLDPVG